MITIVTFAWQGTRNYGAPHVASLAAMLHRHLTCKYRFVAIVDNPNGDFGPNVDVMEMPPNIKTLSLLKTPEKGRFPSCYCRLWLFSSEARMLGERIILTDVDIVVTNDWAPLLNQTADFVGWLPGQAWGNTERRVAGGMWLLRTGSRTNVYDDFVRDPQAAIKEARQAGFRGSDQAWISYKLARDAPIWPKGSGIYSVRDFTRKDRSATIHSIPSDARVVHFNGIKQPWERASWKQHPWLADYWIGEVV